ncbi:MAG: hypothetical protein KC656_34255 [Myxococcales bacterium]|nr:hypothetical protein [Myxococcales bacterium]
MSRALSFVVLALSASVVAHADENGTPGTISSMRVHTPSADSFLQYHGRVQITSSQDGRNLQREYRWGGLSCGSRVLEPDEVAMLQQAHIHGFTIKPIWKPGQGTTRCLVGFDLR